MAAFIAYGAATPDAIVAASSTHTMGDSPYVLVGIDGGGQVIGGVLPV